jgi:tRNA-specific 2-thiouridylase
MKQKMKKVIVAMSGGVDSSVAAALLKKQGYEVAGVFMRFWSENKNAPNLCCSEGAQKAARAVAAKLKIPFYVFNFEKEFKKEVVDYFLAEQKVARTPNPCVVCNKKIKFGLLFEKALALGVDFLATGHYARLRRKIANRKSQIAQFHLSAARDRNKDQSYFLYNLTQARLQYILFPVGEYLKEEVYQMAKKWRLPYRKEESFDLCFVANDAESFIKKYLKLRPGKIMNYSYCHSRESGNPDYGSRVKPGMTQGVILDEHPGLPLYTIGQRKSISVPRGPWWVIKKDEKNNILYVSNHEKDLYSRELIVSKLNWIDGQAPKLPLNVCAKIRYKSEASAAILRIANRKSLASLRGRSGQIAVEFKKPQRAITPGQSVVFYKKNGEVIGGGEIK